MALNSVHASHWVNVILEEHKKFIEKNTSGPEEQIKFLQQQYEQLSLLNRAILGKVIFVGAPPID